MIELTDAVMPFWNTAAFIGIGIALLALIAGLLICALVPKDVGDKIGSSFFVIAVIGSISGLSIFGAYDNGALDYRVAVYETQLEEAGYANVEVSEAAFTASKDGAYVSGVIAEHEGRTLAIEVENGESND